MKELLRNTLAPNSSRIPKIILITFEINDTMNLQAITLTGIVVNVIYGYYFMINRIKIYPFLIL